MTQLTECPHCGKHTNPVATLGAATGHLIFTCEYCKWKLKCEGCAKIAAAIDKGAEGYWTCSCGKEWEWGT